jgi:hypothetical protein
MFSISEDLLVLDGYVKGIVVVLLEQSELLCSEETRQLDLPPKIRKAKRTASFLTGKRTLKIGRPDKPASATAGTSGGRLEAAELS